LSQTYHTNKVVVITGGSSGIGAALVRYYAKKGWHVVAAARSVAALDQLSQELKLNRGIVLPIICDVTVEEQCAKLIEKTISQYGRLDVLICNAGISMRALFEKTELSVLQNLMQVNFWGAVYCCKHALPHLLKSQGSIVGVSSIAGKVGLPGRTGYSASKFALEGFLSSLRTENLPNNLHVLVACPGFTASNIREAALQADGNPQGQSPRNEGSMMSADEVAGHIYRAVAIRRRDLVLTRQGHLSVFLSKWLPGWLDRLVFNTMSKEGPL